MAHQSLLDDQSDFKVDVKIEVSNDIVRTILNLVEIGNYDLVVVGASERSQVGKFLFGTIPLKLAEQSPCPVVIIRRGMKISG